uniref:CUB domain-containing protein n=1 Tax=Branchiostoma floridae TaxID=7739 RepID=C3XRB7_BRAFL|eukprot:XP_002613226.1 hypothetical protein BRAFLDRAFT_73165 [Branchiostoma floridae]
MMGRVGSTISIVFFIMTGCAVAALRCYSCSTTQVNSSVCGRRATKTDLATCGETEKFCYVEVVTVGSVPIWLERGCTSSCAGTDTCRSSGDGTGVCRDCCQGDGCNGGVPNTDWSGPGNAVTSCGGTFLEDSGTVSTPSYPDNYPNNINCEFLFPDTGQIMTVKFKDFHLEGRDWLSRCHDSIMVYAHNKLVDEFCGEENPGTIISYGSGVRIVFMSDYSVSKTGFTLTYSRTQRLASTDGLG